MNESDFQSPKDLDKQFYSVKPKYICRSRVWRGKAEMVLIGGNCWRWEKLMNNCSISGEWE